MAEEKSPTSVEAARNSAADSFIGVCTHPSCGT